MNYKFLWVTLFCTAAAAQICNAATAQAGEFYKWTDASGIVHYSDLPPPQDVGKVERVHVIGGSTITAATPSPSAADVDAAKLAATPPAVPSETAEERARLCNQSRASLELLQSKYPVSSPAKAGAAPSILDDQQRQSRITLELGNIDKYCK